MYSTALLLPLAASLATASKPSTTDFTQYALTSTGDTNGGNTFPGVSRPLGMVKLGPDLYDGANDLYSGYSAQGNFTGFSMLHESGTGGAPKYCVVSQMPHIGNISNPLSDAMNDTRAVPDHTEVGYYKAQLGQGTTVEMGATTKAGIYQYTFPNTKDQKSIVVDVSHVLASYRGQGLGQNFLGGNITIHSEGASKYYYTGYGTYDNGWNEAGPWTAYFCGHFNATSSYKTFLGADFTTDQLVQYSTNSSLQSKTARLGALFTFKDTSVVSRVGVSFISASQACSNLDEQIPDGTSLSQVKQETKDAWNEDVFSKVTTTSTNTTMLTQLYSALYFMHLLPTNKSGENPLWESTEPYYDDVFTFWDLHRCHMALLQILQPTYYEEFLRALIDIFRNEGWTSDARSSFWNGAVQGGSNSDNIFADAYMKGVRGKIDWDGAYASMVKNAEVNPPNNHDPRDPSGSTMQGRGSLPDWLEYGYVTPKFGRSVSNAVEYSVNDFSLASIAAATGRTDDFHKYFNRSHNWRNHWNTNLTALNFTGFVGPRDANGTFIDQNPLSCGGCYWGDYYYEALPWAYSLNAKHDIDHLVKLCAGKEKFVERLEMTFTPGVVHGGNFNGTLMDPSNEPMFNTPYLYSYVNRPDLSVERSRFIAKQYYFPTPGGLPGNSDAGAMESWLLWNMIGLYPQSGQTTFFIGSPWFSDLTISLGGGKQLKMTAKGGSETAYHVQSLKVNGRHWDKTWLSYYDIFAHGGTMEFVLGEKPVEWATGATPPSPGSLNPGEAMKLLQRMSKGSTA